MERLNPETPMLIHHCTSINSNKVNYKHITFVQKTPKSFSVFAPGRVLLGLGHHYMVIQMSQLKIIEMKYYDLMVGQTNLL